MAVTTLIDTTSNVILASSIGLILSDIFGPIGWVYNAVFGSLVIMTILFLLPKAIGIENALRMAVWLAPSTNVVLNALSPAAIPLTSFARGLSERIVGKPSYKVGDLADELEEVVLMLERAGHIEPDAGRLLRSALSSSKNLAADIVTKPEDVVSVSAENTVREALITMGRTFHPRIPVYDYRKKAYVGAVTFHTLAKAISRGLLDSSLDDYMIQPARLDKADTLATVVEKLQDAGTTIAFVYDGEEILGMVTLSDIIEKILGFKA